MGGRHLPGVTLGRRRSQHPLGQLPHRRNHIHSRTGRAYRNGRN